MSIIDAKIVVDIGGTNVRFGLVLNGVLQEDTIQKYQAADFESFESALDAYCKKSDIDSVYFLLIATAARHNQEQNTWNFINDHDETLHSWVIDPVALKNKNYPVYFVLNDFEAATWGLSVLDDAQQTEIRSGALNAPKYPRIMTGPGTGLGLAYLDQVESGALHVRSTFGAHMLAAPATDEHYEIIQQVRAQKPQYKAVVWEDLISGAGLFNIYTAHCEVNGKDQTFQDKAALFNALASPDLTETLRLFHELFGTYLSTVFIPGHALGGIYLTGGVTDTLIEEGLFDKETLLTYMTPDLVTPVTEALKSLRVFHVTDEFTPLRGLIAAERNNVQSISYD